MTYPAVNPWSVVGPLVGALIVALIGAASIQIASGLQHKRDRRATLTEVRRTQYFSGLEAADEMLAAVNTFGNNLSGRIDPSDASTTEEAQEMVERDQRAADAVDRLIDEARNLHRATVLVGAVGSPGVRRAMEALQSRVDLYITTAFGRVDFKGADYNDFVDDYTDLFDALTIAVRADLEVDDLFIADRNSFQTASRDN